MFERRPVLRKLVFHVVVSLSIQSFLLLPLPTLEQSETVRDCISSCIFEHFLDENGCIVSPPSITIVLLTMHGWYITSKDFIAKVIEMYPTIQLNVECSAVQLNLEYSTV